MDRSVNCVIPLVLIHRNTHSSICMGDIGHIPDCTEDYPNNVNMFSAACAKIFCVTMETNHWG